MHGQANIKYEIYLLIKYIKSVLWRVAKCLSYIEEARRLKVNLERIKMLTNSQLKPGFDIHAIMWNFWSTNSCDVQQVTFFLLIPPQISAANSRQEKTLHNLGAGVRRDAFGWGTALQAGRWRVPFPMGPILSAALGRGVDLASTGMSTKNVTWGVKAVGA